MSDSRSFLVALPLAALILAGLADPSLSQQQKAQGGDSAAASQSSGQPGMAAAAEAAPVAPYDTSLTRLSEVLGSIQYLRSICRPDDTAVWRQDMQRLIDLEARNEPVRRQQFTAAFNRGYRAFAALYSNCTPAATVAEERYRNEGATLAAEIAARYGN